MARLNRTYTTSDAFIEALVEAGVSYIFANFGSDHSGLIEALAKARASGTPVPSVITCPSEFVAMSAADGVARITGQAQAVVVHVECGTQALGGAVHNAAKGRVPVLVFAGASPYTIEGEEHGSRGEFIQWIQDVFDQRGIVRGYMKYDNEIRSGSNVKQMVHRALQFAHSSPCGPVYLMAAREVMQQECQAVALDLSRWRPVTPAALQQDAADAILADLSHAARPLIVTSYLGRDPAAVVELVRFADRLGIGVLESVPSTMNFPPDNPLHQGIQWNQAVQNEALAAADAVLVLDSDIPWIPLHNRPAASARIHHIDLDVLKEQMPLFYIPAICRAKADCATALRQLNAVLDTQNIPASRVAERCAYWAAHHNTLTARIRSAERKPAKGVAVGYVLAALRTFFDEKTVVLNESVTNFSNVFEHLAMGRPGSIYTSGAGALGWSGGAALGMKLAAPDKTIVAISGDGSYMFSQPSAVHWMSRTYRAPFLQIVLNNRGWKAPKMSMLSQYPDGHASEANEIGVAFDPPPDYAGIAAAAGGAYAAAIKEPDGIEAALAEAIYAVRVERRSAVLDVWLPHL